MAGRYGRALTVVATVGSGLMAGVFFAFSTFVMTALGRLPDRQGLVAMQEIKELWYEDRARAHGHGGHH